MIGVIFINIKHVIAIPDMSKISNEEGMARLRGI